MGAAAKLICKLRTWIQNRQGLDINASATWFLLSFVYVKGLSSVDGGIGFRWSGIIPVLEVPLLFVVAALICLTISTAILVEPLLPCKWRTRTKKIRCEPVWRYFFQFHVLIAFVFGFLAGLVELIGTLPSFSWLINLTAYTGFVVVLAILANMMLLVWSMVKSVNADNNA